MVIKSEAKFDKFSNTSLSNLKGEISGFETNLRKRIHYLKDNIDNLADNLTQVNIHQAQNIDIKRDEIRKEIDTYEENILK